jgi:hypothetical protein
LIQKAIDILKIRWPEVMLVVVLQAAMMMLAEEVVTISENAEAQGAMLPIWASFLLGFGIMLFAILWQMIYLGFLKTSAVSGGEPQQPMQLLRSGRPYFWRILFFQIMLGFALVLLNSVLASSFGGLIWKGRPFAEMPQWFVQICALVGILIVLKPLLLVPAQMIVYDITVFQAIYRMRFCRISSVDNFFRVIFICFGAIILSTLLVGSLTPKTTAYYIFSGLHQAAFSFILLTLTLIAVLWIQQQFEAECVKASEEESYA